ncbi:hypothetical protein [Aeromicrobium sp. CTD01-1L150]|uniref:hypothetical protein n=1 Tax=Aeromicrobium sp. CTD01-1L150 TaxID=3341830 RepID=UPI0035BF60AD
MRVLAPLLVLALLAAACGGSDARETSAKARESAAAQDEGQLSDDAVFVPEALRGFRCEAGDDDIWYAVGTVKNTTKQPVAYRVTVQVGQGGDDLAASAVDLPAVEPDQAAEFTIDELPGAGSDGPCRVQVMAVPPEG